MARLRGPENPRRANCGGTSHQDQRPYGLRLLFLLEKVAHAAAGAVAS
jgi:hypothetical protein